MPLVLVLILIVPITYICLLALLMKTGWARARKEVPSPAIEYKKITVLIPVRNEAKTIGTLLEQLKSMTYPNFDVIVVDDHSTDTTASVVENVTRIDGRFTLVKNDGVGKKQALTTGVKSATGAVIVTTDSDCQVHPSWLTQVNRFFQAPDTRMLFGGVSIQAKTFFGHLQAIEFASLIGSGISLWALRKPIMCNGANLAFRREVFFEVNGYTGNENIASGDDEFLMRKILARYPSGIIFLNDGEGTVQTGAAPDIKTFIQQRLRWAGKWRHNQSVASKITAVYILLVQLAWIAALFFVAIFPATAKMLVFVLLMRLAVEAWFLIPVCRFLKIKWRWDAFLTLQFIYPFYVVGIGLFSNLTTVTWKDRRI